MKEKTLTLTVNNPHVSEAQEVEIVVRGATAGAVKGAQLSAPDIQAHNTFENPTVVGIKDATVAAVQNGVLVHRFPPASVTRLQFTLT